MKRVAIPVRNGKLSEYFGKCNFYKVFDIDNEIIREEDFELPGVSDINELPVWAYKNGITDIISHKIDKKIIMLFNKYKINLFVGVSIDIPGKLIQDFIEEKISSNRKIINQIMSS